MARDLPDLTRGPILGSLVRLAVPIVLANLLQTAYQLIDTFWVGRLGADAVAAVSLSFPVIFLLISLGSGLSVAGSVLVAQGRGRRDQARVNRVAAQTLLLITAAAALLSLTGYFISPVLVRLMGAQPDVLPGAVSYLRISFYGLVFVFGYFGFQSLMRGVGNTLTPFLIVLGTVLLNLVLDPLFIMGWGPIPAQGVAGAAIATVFTQALALGCGLVLLFRPGHGLQLQRQAFRPDPPLMGELIRLGLPASVEQSTRAMGLLAMTFLVAAFGTVTLAAYGIGMRILSFVFIPALGLSMATSALVGQNIGAQRLERARAIARLSALLAFAVLTAVGVLVYLFARPLVAAFVPGAALTIAQGTQFIHVIAFTFGLIGAQLVLTGAFRGAGNTLAAMLIALLSLWAFRLPLAWVLSRHTRLAQLGLWLSFPLGSLLSTGAALAWFARGAVSYRHSTYVRASRANADAPVR